MTILVMLGLIRKVYADLKVRELLETPNVKSRAISSEAILRNMERSETKVLEEINVLYFI